MNRQPDQTKFYEKTNGVTLRLSGGGILYLPDNPSECAQWWNFDTNEWDISDSRELRATRHLVWNQFDIETYPWIESADLREAKIEAEYQQESNDYFKEQHKTNIEDIIKQWMEIGDNFNVKCENAANAIIEYFKPHK